MSAARSEGSEEGTAGDGARRGRSRTRALAADLGATADPELQALSDLVRTALDVSAAVVSLVRFDQQAHPGLSDLAEPRAATRAAPQADSFARAVVDAGAPLVLADVRVHPLLGPCPTVTDPGVVAFAGMPLTDEAGRVLGALCAVLDRPRDWSVADQETLRTIAQACSTVLRLRLARYDAGREDTRRDELEIAQRLALQRSQILLRASQAFSDTSTVADVRVRIGQLVSTDLRPTHIGIVLRDEHGLLRPAELGVDRHQASGIDRHPTLDLLAATAANEQRIVRYSTRDEFDRDHPAETRRALRDLGLHSVVAVPLPGVDEPVGALVLGWGAPHAARPADLLTIATIAGYVAQALDRARVLHHRISVAHEMQDAMLTTLPEVDGLAMAARYQPADTRETIGGDWYDAAPLRDPGDADGFALIVSVGDVIGHALTAATIMGQVRSMLRQSAWDHPAGPPSTILDAFERANFGLDLAAAGTAILAILRRSATGRWSMSWTNAGHPPPILLLPDGTTELLDAHDALFGFRATSHLARGDQHRDLAPGTVVFLYTDGVVERRGSDLDEGTATLLALVDRLRDRAPQEMVDTVVTTLCRGATDDVVAFAIRVP